jgi:hypothetical protein
LATRPNLPHFVKTGRAGILALVVVLGVLCGIIIAWSGGVMGFLQEIDERSSPVAIITMASLIGVIFILLIRIGVSLTYVEEIGASNA